MTEYQDTQGSAHAHFLSTPGPVYHPASPASYFLISLLSLPVSESLSSFFFSSSGTPIIRMLVRLMLSQRPVRLSSILFILFSLSCSVVVISTILSSRSLILSSASVILLLIPSRVFFISFIVFFIVAGCSLVLLCPC